MIYWAVTLRRLAGGYGRFGVTCCLHREDRFMWHPVSSYIGNWLHLLYCCQITEKQQITSYYFIFISPYFSFFCSLRRFTLSSPSFCDVTLRHCVHVAPTYWDHYAVTKRQAPCTQWRSVTSQEDGHANYVDGKPKKFQLFLYCFPCFSIPFCPAVTSLS
jgi:hypothetical protein